MWPRQMLVVFEHEHEHERDGNGNETRTGRMTSTDLFLFVSLDFYREFWQISSTRPSYRN